MPRPSPPVATVMAMTLVAKGGGPTNAEWRLPCRRVALAARPPVSRQNPGRRQNGECGIVKSADKIREGDMGKPRLARATPDTGSPVYPCYP